MLNSHPGPNVVLTSTYAGRRLAWVRKLSCEIPGFEPSELLTGASQPGQPVGELASNGVPGDSESVAVPPRPATPLGASPLAPAEPRRGPSHGRARRGRPRPAGRVQRSQLPCRARAEVSDGSSRSASRCVPEETLSGRRKLLGRQIWW